MIKPQPLSARAPSSTQAPSAAPYMSQLDALRALAILAVMGKHFWPGASRFVLPWGDVGVRLFFVLSGFLITGILLRCRERREVEGIFPLLGRFYVRRALRIFPLYYAVLLVAAAVNIRPARATFGWHFFYATNFLCVSTGHWPGPLSHFWSLAVEEQFYLLWPCLMLFLPVRALLPVIAAMIAFGPLSRAALLLAGWSPIALQVLLPCCFDSLGLGALLAFSHHFQTKTEALPRFALWLGAPLSAVFLLARALGVTMPRGSDAVLFELAISCCFVWLIARAAQGFAGATGALLSWRPLLFLGKISYGIYVFHNFMPVVLPRVFKVLGLQLPSQEGPLRFVLLSGASVLVAFVSWRAFENPINELKRFFPYAKGAKPG